MFKIPFFIFILLVELVLGKIFSQVPTHQGLIFALVYLRIQLYWINKRKTHRGTFHAHIISKSKVGNLSRGRPEGSLFNSYDTEV